MYRDESNSRHARSATGTCWRRCSIGRDRSARSPQVASGLGWAPVLGFNRPAEPRSTPMKTRAAVAVAAGKPIEVTEVDLEGPRDGEVMIEIKATGICHTDDFTLSGADPEGLFPAI